MFVFNRCFFLYLNSLNTAVESVISVQIIDDVSAVSVPKLVYNTSVLCRRVLSPKLFKTTATVKLSYM